MKTVWVCTSHWCGEGEGWDEIGVFSTEKKCIKYAESLVKHYQELLGEDCNVFYNEVWQVENEDSEVNIFWQEMEIDNG